MSRALTTQVTHLFDSRILNFDVKPAQAFADCAIAAIAKANGFMVATRNVRDFAGTNVDIIDPWAFN